VSWIGGDPSVAPLDTPLDASGSCGARNNDGERVTDAGVCMPAAAAAAAAAAQKLQLERWMRGTTRSISCSICIATCIRYVECFAANYTWHRL